MAKHKVPGLSVSVVKDDKIIFERGFGYRNLEELLPMTENTLIGIGSISKSFTALAILQLQEKGLLNISDPIKKYFPWFPENPDKPILLKHLLSHSSGFPALDGTIIEMLHHNKRHIDFTPIISRSDLEWYVKSAEKERLFEPGERFFYNNDMYALIGYIIEDITGQKFSEYMREHCLSKLEMIRTSYNSDDVKKDSLNDFSTGYCIEDNKVTTYSHPYSDFLDPPGGILSSAHEMANYIQLILHRGQFHDSLILHPETCEILWNPIIKCPYSYKGEGYYGLGWVREERFGTTLLQHGGGLSSSTASLMILPELNIGVFSAENDANANCRLITEGILAILTGNDPEELPALKYKNLISMVEGTYKSYRELYSLKLETKGPLLMAHLEIDDGDFDIPISVEDPENLIFTIPTGFPDQREKIQFVRDEKTGKISYATFDRYLYHRI
ncbi:MAG: serine hydrolase [Candidatus Lokiarchaeota archaeon]|nr:serine hydrolase [Candidatus Lokiarchaeota archaeon]